MNSLCRKRAVRQRIAAQRRCDLELIVHAGGTLAEPSDERFQAEEQRAAARMVITFFHDHLPQLLDGYRPGRVTEVLRLVQERFAILDGDMTFEELATSTADGASRRTVENRLRQRYVRALHTVVATIDAHVDDVIRNEYDPSTLRASAVCLFSDRVPTRSQTRRRHDLQRPSPRRHPIFAQPRHSVGR
jgi:hypothetical protein